MQQVFTGQEDQRGTERKDISVFLSQVGANLFIGNLEPEERAVSTLT